MTTNANDKTSYTSNEDRSKLGALLAAAYGAHLSLIYATQKDGGAEVVETLGIVSAVYAALHIPYVKEIPYGLSKLFVRAAMARDLKSAPENVQKIFDDLCRKMDFKAKLRVNHAGIKGNALALDDTVYVGSELVKSLSDEEIEFVLAHELSHLKAGDNSTIYLSCPPYINAMIMAAVSVMATLGTGFAKPEVYGQNMAVAGLFVGYYLFQKALFKTYSRVVETKTDRNAIDLTGNFEAAMRALVLISPVSSISDHSAWKKIFASHPIGWQRIEDMERYITGDGTTPRSDEARAKLIAHLEAKALSLP